MSLETLDYQDLQLFASLIPTLVAVLLLGTLLAMRIRTRKADEQVEELRQKLARSGAQHRAQSREQGRIIAQLSSERGSIANLALSLPSVVQELNRGDTDPRRVPRLIYNLAEALFQPSQFLFYRTTPSKQPGRPPELVLQIHRGFSKLPDELRRIPFGEGRIGWVASHRIDMLREDWLNFSRTQGDKIGENHPEHQGDIIGPMIQHSLEGEQVLGVISIGTSGERGGDDKLMFQLVTNLGSLALVNAQLVTRLRDRANTDGLTSLLNKRYFMEEQLARMIVAAERDGQTLTLFIFDIDHFKKYNDTNGHPAGDELLRQLSQLLRDSVRSSDSCCRYGGEEFVVAMPDTTREEGYALADRIRSLVESHPFEHREKQPSGKVSISGGIAVFPGDGVSAAALTKHADEALYESKRQGRNRVTIYQGVEIGTADEVSGFDMVSAEADGEDED